MRCKRGGEKRKCKKDRSVSITDKNNNSQLGTKPAYTNLRTVNLHVFLPTKQDLETFTLAYFTHLKGYGHI